MRRTVAILAALCLFAACSSDDSDEPAAPAGSTTSGATSGTTVSTTSTSTTVPSPSTTAPCVTRGGTDPVRTTTARRAALLRAVRATGARCADRVAFDFTTEANGTPTCTIAYDQPPFYEDASGRPTEVSGSAFVRVRCAPAYGYDYAAGGAPTYTGPKEITATGTQHVRELVETGDFEAVLTWIIGLDEQRPFTVATATVPGPRAVKRLTIRFS